MKPKENEKLCMNLQMNKLEMMNIHFVMIAKMNVEMKNAITVLILKNETI